MVSENSQIMQVWVIVATNCLALTRCMKVSYVEGHEQGRFFFQRVTSNIHCKLHTHATAKNSPAYQTKIFLAYKIKNRKET
jgi:hypothetical protein